MEMTIYRRPSKVGKEVQERSVARLWPAWMRDAAVEDGGCGCGQVLV